MFSASLSSKLALAAGLVMVILISFGASSPAQAQADSAENVAKPLDVDINAGTIIPNNKTGLYDTVPGWGARVSIPSSRGVFELGGFLGRGNSIIYRSVVADYRIDFNFDPVAAHFLIGFHGDQFFQDQPTQLTKNFAGGWNFGGGTSMNLAGPLFARADFLYRIGPGQILQITVGLGYHFPLGSGS